jgi:nucleotide-binding universal stress UspA family protein
MKFLLFVSDRKFSEPVIEFSRVLAKQSESHLNLHYVCQTSSRSDGEDTIAKAQSVLADVVMATRVDEGLAIDRLLEEIGRDNYDLVLVGAREGLGYLQRKLSSLSLKVIDRSPIPILIVRHPHAQLKKALICLGPMVFTQKRLNHAINLVGRLVPHQVDLLHVTGMVPSMYTGLDEMDETLKEMLDTDTPMAINLRRGVQLLSESGLKGELHLRHGTVVETILREAEKGNYDLIVLGQSGAGESVQGFLMGNVTRQVIEDARCPVLVIK